MARAVGPDAKEARRVAILAAAKEVFAAKGFHAATIGDVAKAAAISYGSVYWYFDSKDALFHALMDDQERALRAHVEAAVAVTATAMSDAEVPVAAGTGAAVLAGGEALFRRAVQATFEFFEADRDVAQLLFRDALVLGDRFDRHLSGIYEGYIAEIEKTIAAAQSAGLVMEAPPRLVALSVAALISQLALRRLTTDDGLGADVVADFVVTLLLEGLLPRGGGTP